MFLIYKWSFLKYETWSIYKNTINPDLYVNTQNTYAFMCCNNNYSSKHLPTPRLTINEKRTSVIILQGYKLTASLACGYNIKEKPGRTMYVGHRFGWGICNYWIIFETSHKSLLTGKFIVDNFHPARTRMLSHGIHRGTNLCTQFIDFK